MWVPPAAAATLSVSMSYLMQGVNVAVVTGGGGFVGQRLCSRLLSEGCREVRAFDLTHGPKELLVPMAGCVDVKGDVTDFAAVAKCIEGAEIVFHVASFGMSGRDMLDKERVREVNIRGTDNVLRACLAAGVARLVYTSTYNVVFGGQPIYDGDETMPRYPLEKHVDEYSRSKAVAEEMVLRASGTRHARGVLHATALRPAAIYGEMERRHLPRILSWVEIGFYRFSIGDRKAKVDWLFVDNLIDAQILAARGLSLPTPSYSSSSSVDNSYLASLGTGGSGGGGGNVNAPLVPVASGESYFVNDGPHAAINNFAFLDAIISGLGFSTRKFVRLPVPVALLLAHLVELLHRGLRKVWDFEPIMTRAEVYKVGVQHTFSTAKAKRDLGYEPRVRPADAVNRVIEHLRAAGHFRHQFVVAPPSIWAAILFGLFSLTAAAYPSLVPFPALLWPICRPTEALALALFRSREGVRIACWLSYGIHVLESGYAFYRARKIGHRDTAVQWWAQTLVLGWFSLRLMPRGEGF